MGFLYHEQLFSSFDTSFCRDDRIIVILLLFLPNLIVTVNLLKSLNILLEPRFVQRSRSIVNLQIIKLMTLTADKLSKLTLTHR